MHIRIVVSVNIDCEPGNWAMRREIRPNERKNSPLWIHILNSGVASIVEIICVVGSLCLGGTSFFCVQLMDSFQIDKCS
jgi:hypothetical protein